MTDPAGSPSNAAETDPHADRGRIRAVLDVAVGVPDLQIESLSRFPAHVGPADIELDEPDPVAFSGALTYAVVRRTSLLCVHAAVVSAPAGAIVIPGFSGLGKSTLTAALVRAGFGYMSDEMAAFERPGGLVRAFPRDLTMTVRSLRVVGLGRPGTPDEVEMAVPLSEFGVCGAASAKAAMILLVQREGAGFCFRPGSAGEAAGALITNSFNHFRWPASSLATVSQVAASADVFHVRYTDATDLATELSRRVLQ